MTTHKAKRIDNGEWITSMTIENKRSGLWFKDVDFKWVKVDPSTLCERVRGTEFFEGDEVYSKTHDLTGIITYSENSYSWRVRYGEESFRLDFAEDWKPTGKNRQKT